MGNSGGEGLYKRRTGIKVDECCRVTGTSLRFISQWKLGYLRKCTNF